jgi:hypothetical protein
MTAVVVRSVLLRTQVRPGLTWLIVLLLVGLGSVGPDLLAYFVFRTPLTSHEDVLARVTNPFWSIDHAMGYYDGSSPEPFSFVCLPVLLIWAGIATVCALPWLMKQFVRFAPPQKTERPEVLVEPVLAESGATA